MENENQILSKHEHRETGEKKNCDCNLDTRIAKAAGIDSYANLLKATRFIPADDRLSHIQQFQFINCLSLCRQDAVFICIHSVKTNRHSLDLLDVSGSSS